MDKEVRMLSRKVDECKPLGTGTGAGQVSQMTHEQLLSLGIGGGGMGGELTSSLAGLTGGSGGFSRAGLGPLTAQMIAAYKGGRLGLPDSAPGRVGKL